MNFIYYNLVMGKKKTARWKKNLGLKIVCLIGLIALLGVSFLPFLGIL